MRRFYERFLSVRDIPVPVVAAINGPAIGAGAAVVKTNCVSHREQTADFFSFQKRCELSHLCFVFQALACDIRVASASAKIGFTFVKLGLHPGKRSSRVACSRLGICLIFFARSSNCRDGLNSLFTFSHQPSNCIQDAPHWRDHLWHGS